MGFNLSEFVDSLISRSRSDTVQCEYATHPKGTLQPTHTARRRRGGGCPVPYSPCPMP
ncbi:MAG: hypothetical protein F6J93_21265 [Oscillatoria sp. SIO1A7]|nr:hypothetical protein [Oscillatoria sp. SIO1A7]